MCQFFCNFSPYANPFEEIFQVFKGKFFRSGSPDFLNSNKPNLFPVDVNKKIHLGKVCYRILCIKK